MLVPILARPEGWGVFGIGEEDAELLERLLREQLPQAEPEEREPVTTWEDPLTTVRRWVLVIPRFREPNGNEGPVLSAWALEPGRDRPHHHSPLTPP